ncbi:MAG: PHP domain-containing protein [Candidatus Dormibacteria bacterium]
MSAPVLPDRHVHSQWSWDARYGDMLATCRRAADLGLPAVAFTEHADFTPWENGQPRVRGVRIPDNSARTGDLDIVGYWDSIDRCRAACPDLHIESGVELGEAHLFPDRVDAMLGHRPLDRVLGSVHCILLDGVLTDLSAHGLLTATDAPGLFARYLEATLDLVTSAAPFAILAHLDYPKRYWPHAELPFDERDHEDQLRDVLRALARSGRILEINSSRALAAPRGPNPGPVIVRWWYEEGGGAVSFGSDAHQPEHLAAGLGDLAAIAEMAGFRGGKDPLAFWTR